MSETRFLWPPKVLLPLKGRLDARKGPAAASAYVDKIRQRLSVLSAQEVMEVEKTLQKTRQDATGSLAERNRTLEKLAALPPAREEDSPAAIRANRCDAAEYNRLRAALEGYEAAILADNETLVNAKILLEERLARLQAMTQERISLYVMGVRSSSELKAFACPQSEEDTSTPSADGHQALDSELQRVAEALITTRKEVA